MVVLSLVVFLDADLGLFSLFLGVLTNFSDGRRFLGLVAGQRQRAFDTERENSPLSAVC